VETTAPHGSDRSGVSIAFVELPPAEALDRYFDDRVISAAGGTD
jgi:hypothetical protein